jgi:hypothetical protein
MGIIALLFVLANPAHSLQAADPPAEKSLADQLNLQFSLRTRLEASDWFTANQGDGTYSYLGSIGRVQIGQQREFVDWQIELAIPLLLGLPDNANAPAPQGSLGLGALYFNANQARNSVMLFPKQAFIRWHGAGNGHSLKLGRFDFADGSEITPKSATLAALKNARVNTRLIGNFGFTHVGRSFDGVHYTLGKPAGTLTFVGAVPTRGVFQTDGWGWNKTAFGYLSYTKAVGSPNSAGDLRLFGVYYHDWRRVLKVDNRPLGARAADSGNIGIYTWGGHYAHALTTGAGTVDVLLWGAAQNGRWGSLDHRGAAVDIEAGWQPKILPRLKPWIRGGYYRGSGDKNASDSTHGSFFQMLPTPRPFARFPFFDMINNEDAFGILILRPHTAVTVSSEVHSLRLTQSQDLWYQGGGAFQPWVFGYVGRPSSGRSGLATLWDVNVDWKVNKHWSLTAYFANAAGKGVVSAIYPRGNTARFAYLESTFRF